jgi:hypothetical protein
MVTAGRCRALFQGEPGKVGRGVMGARTHGNDCEDDNRDHAPAWGLRLSYGVLRV